MDAILLIGVNHRIAPVEVRERLAFGPERIPAALQHFVQGSETACEPSRKAHCSEAVLLSTCNRTEIYLVASDPQEAQTQVQAYLSAYAHLPLAELQNLLYVKQGEAAVRHLVRVAAGLDSLVLGENEILGQVKDAYELAHQAGTPGATLSALFRCAVQAGKRVRSQTELGRLSLSVATVVVELAEELFGSLSERTALLLGAGKISSITGRALVRAGLRCVLVSNRTFERAQKLAESLPGGRAVHFDALPENLACADIVICSTSAPHTVLHTGAVEATMAKRPERPLLVADLAVPRDAEPAIGGLPGVRLVDIDDLEDLVRQRHPLAHATREAAETIVSEEVQAFECWCNERRCAPLIRALRCQADRICQAEVETTLRRLDDLTPEQRKAVEAMGQAIVGKLLHQPIAHIKTPPTDVPPEDWTGWVQEMFGIPESELS